MHPDLTWWTARRGAGPIVATAIHAGHAVREEVLEAMCLDEAARLREEDPFTGDAVVGVANNIIVHRSRFEVDLNRSRTDAVYRSSEQSWGLEVWRGEPEQDLIERSLLIYDAYYSQLAALLDDIGERHSRFVLLDVHSYNHRRDGPRTAPSLQNSAPDINIGTFSMPRDDWRFVLDPLMEEMRHFDFAGRRLDVRENVAFQGKGEQTRFVHNRYPGRGCAIALEFKKFYMDEWTGEPDPQLVSAMKNLIQHIANKTCELLEE